MKQGHKKPPDDPKIMDGYIKLGTFTCSFRDHNGWVDQRRQVFKTGIQITVQHHSVPAAAVHLAEIFNDYYFFIQTQNPEA